MPCTFIFAYAEATVFLKAAYVFFRILLDTLAGMIEYFYKKNEGIKVPNSFNDLLKKEKRAELPPDLSGVLSNAHKWFPEFTKKRDDLVHHYKYFLIFFSKKKRGGTNILGHSNIVKNFANIIDIKEGNLFEDYREIRQYLGFLLSGYQKLVDDLLDHLDTKVENWYGIIASRSTRTQVQMEGDAAYMLWWAVKYGDYKHPDLVLHE